MSLYCPTNRMPTGDTDGITTEDKNNDDDGENNNDDDDDVRALSSVRDDDNDDDDDDDDFVTGRASHSSVHCKYVFQLEAESAR